MQTTAPTDPVLLHRTATQQRAAEVTRPGLIDALRTAVGAANVVVDPDITASYSRDMMPLAPSGSPLAVVLPTRTSEVVAVVRACAAAGVPIVPRGAGSGLTGAANAVDGAVSVVMTKMNSILEIDEGNRLAVVQPGVVNLAFRTEVESRGLFYAPDPSSYDWCTLGGNLSTNAGGLCCVKYGVTTDAVLPKLDRACVTSALDGVVTADNQLCCDGGKAITGFARKGQIPCCILPSPGGPMRGAPDFHINNVNGYHGRLKEWLRPFHGVATKYLANYLGWRRTLEALGTEAEQRGWLRSAVGIGVCQQATR